MTIKFGNRRLQKGTSSYFVFIPPACVESMGIAKGAKLAVEMLEDYSLRLVPQ
jgi:hypothetical protein